MDVQPITVPQSLAYVLNAAADKSNVDFDYLVKTAMRESSLNPDAKAPSSSAVGLFQFLDSTWLQVMKEEGPRLGYQSYADAITKDSSGDYVVKDKKLRAQILKLREDPQVAADMAAAFTEANGQYLQSKFGRMPSPGELYIAHFLGPQGAEKLFNAGLDNPDQVAAKLFPSQAKANPQIFYDGKHPRTIREVYKALVSKHNALVAAPVPEADPSFVAQQLASATATTDQGPASVQPATAPTDADPILGPKQMSFSALFSTNAWPPPVAPLIGTEAAAPLIAAKALPADNPMSPTATDPVASSSAIAFAAAAPAPSVSVPASGSPETPLEAIAAATGSSPTLVTVPLPAPAPLLAPASEAVRPVAVASTAVAAASQLGAAAPSTPIFVPPDTAVAIPSDTPVIDLSGATTDAEAETVVPLALMGDPAPLPDAPPPPPAAPQPRIEMTPGTKPNSAFFTQLVWSADGSGLTTP